MKTIREQKKGVYAVTLSLLILAAVAWVGVEVTSDCIGDCVAACDGSGGFVSAEEGWFGACECACAPFAPSP